MNISATASKDISRAGEGRLTNLVAVVTGAARGMGFATSRQFLEEGAIVFMNDISTELIETARERLPDPIRARSHNACGDVLDPRQIDSIVQRAVSQFGGVDILVNNVGVTGPDGTALDVDLDEWERAMRVNVTSMVLMARYAIPQMLKRGVKAS